MVLVADRGKERIVDKRRSFGSNAQEHEGSCDCLNEGGRGEIEKADASGLVGRRCQFDQVAVSDHCSQEFREFAPQVIVLSRDRPAPRLSPSRSAANPDRTAKRRSSAQRGRERFRRVQVKCVGIKTERFDRRLNHRVDVTVALFPCPSSVGNGGFEVLAGSCEEKDRVACGSEDDGRIDKKLDCVHRVFSAHCSTVVGALATRSANSANQV